MIITLRVPHRGEPTTWTAYDRAEFIERQRADALRRGVSMPYWRGTPRDLIETGLDEVGEALGARHGLDTTLYLTTEYSDNPDDYLTADPGEFNAAVEWEGHDLSGCYVVESAEECVEVLACLGGPGAPRIGLCGPVRAAAALRRAAIRAGWLPTAAVED